MRFRVRKAAHVIERVGLAMAGAACGLFVGAYVGSAIPALTTEGFLLLMMVLGFVGFYLGIDTPQLPFDEAHGDIDAAELLSAAGTLCATLTALASVAIIVLRLDPHIDLELVRSVRLDRRRRDADRRGRKGADAEAVNLLCWERSRRKYTAFPPPLWGRARERGSHTACSVE
ncbi:hypothetical protein ACVWXL_007052 [Bradyrhizobium sp. GM22.5]